MLFNYLYNNILVGIIYLYIWCSYNMFKVATIVQGQRIEGANKQMK